LRIDFLRGLAILFVVVDHINLPSLYHVISHERIGAVSGAELFVVLSGLVLGMVYGRRARESTDGWWTVAPRMWSRARTLYVTSLAVLITAYAISFLPWLDASAITTWTDEATGTVYSMYGTTPLLGSYPVPPAAVLDLLFLNVGPFQFNVMGLYVILLALAPFAFILLLRGAWWLLLLLSGALYGLNVALETRLFPSQFENAFPFLSWQLLFFTGLIVGFHWPAITTWFRSGAGRIVIAGSLLAYTGFLLFAWNNPGLAYDPFALKLDWIPENDFRQVYEQFFRRDFLGLLRLANVAVLIISGYVVLTAFWKPINAALGWLLVPLGAATLYVFILHVFFALAAANIPILERDNIWINTLAHTVILLLLWLMVKREFLFRWIPR
jgi:hypothetical protein